MSVPGEPTVKDLRSLTGGGLLARNAVFNLGGSLLPALAALVAVPLLVRGLGAARFGVLALAWTALGYFSLFDFGIGRAVTHGVAARLGGGNREDEIPAVIWTSLATLLPLGLIGGVALFLMAPWLSFDVLHVPSELAAETVQSFRILACAIPFAGITGALRGVLEAKQRFGILNALRIPYGIIMYLGPVLALPFSRSLVPAVTVLVGGRLALAIAHLVVCGRTVPHFWRDSFRWSGDAARALIGFGGWMTVSNIVSPLMNTLDRFVVGAALSVSLVTYYAAPHELATKLWLFTGGVLPVFFPAFATSATRDRAHTSLLFGRVLRIIFGALFLPTLILVLLAREILAVWLGPQFASHSTAVLQVLVIAVFVNSLAQAAYTLIQGLGRPDITGKYHLLELPSYALLLWILLPRFGILGAALAWSIRAVVDAALLLFTSRVLLKESHAEVRRAVTWLGAAIPLLVACIFIPSVVARATVAALSIPVWAVVVWSRILKPEERSAPLRLLVASWRGAGYTRGQRRTS